MAYLGYMTPEEFAAAHPTHPFARPGIHFVPRRPSPTKRPTTAESPKAPPQDKPVEGQ